MNKTLYVECVNCHERMEVSKYASDCPKCKCTGCLIEVIKDD